MRNLYSVNSWIAYVIGEEYYGGYHYVWCTPDFERSASYKQFDPPLPTPKSILKSLSNPTSPKLHAMKEGLRRAAEKHHSSGQLDEKRYQELQHIIEVSEPRDLRPLLYVIPYVLVQNMLLEVPKEKLASPLSREYVIERLPSSLFDVIDVF
jgi:hypothetical protein